MAADDQTAEPLINEKRTGHAVPEISFIIPAYNEQGNISQLYEKLERSIAGLNRTWEILFIDDGSKDGTAAELFTIAENRPAVKIIQLCRNFGQTAAMAAGIDYASGDILVTLDADLQNDPADIALLLSKLEPDVDVVSGWRKQRKDPFFSRVLPSIVANRLISMISGVHLHDYGCSLKAYRREVLKGVRLYGEMHRFIPIYAAWVGATVTEVAVNHHPRTIGSSKYGPSRIFKVLLDLLTIKFLFDYGTKPSYVFGTLGIFAISGSFLVFAWAVILKYGYGTSFILTPLPLLSALLFMVGLQFILMGLLAEMMVRTYHESQGKQIYMVKKKKNC